MKKLALFVLMSSCSYMKIFPDNPLEELVESAIENQTGVKVDFTGESLEKNDNNTK